MAGQAGLAAACPARHRATTYTKAMLVPGLDRGRLLVVVERNLLARALLVAVASKAVLAVAALDRVRKALVVRA